MKSKNKSLYCHMIYESSSKKQQSVRQDIVKYAQANGIKPAAACFHCSKNTVKKWKKRYEEGGIGALVNQRNGPKNIPHKTSKEQEELIIEYRKRAPCYGPKRLKWAFDNVTASCSAIARILKQNNLVRKNRKKHQVKQDLRAAKAKYKALSHHQEDVKHLYDIPYYWEHMTRKKLPRYQFTIRDTKSGLMLLGYGKEYSEQYSTIMTEKYLSHLKSYGIDLGEVTIQTDNGSEFGGGRSRNLNKTGFISSIEERGAKHKFIPPGMCNANADVESVHSTIEKEFFNLENFNNEKEFWWKIQQYQLFYNMARPNFSKHGKTPLQIIMEDRPEVSTKVVNFPVVNLDLEFRLKYCGDEDHYNKQYRGQHLPKLPDLK
jgi:transposase